MRIESAFIADRAEVNPATRTLDVRSGFQSSIRVPKLPFRHVLALHAVPPSRVWGTVSRGPKLRICYLHGYADS